MAETTFLNVVWTSTERFGSQIFQAVFTIILARLLLPADYGLIALMFIFLMVGQILVDGGLSLALLRKKNPTEVDFSTVFWSNIVLGLLFYVIFFCSASVIAQFYDKPQLVLIIKIAGLNFIVWSLGIVHGVKLDIALNFKTQAFIVMSGTLISGLLGVGLAYYGYGVWALVFQFLMGNVWKILCFWVFGERWHPKLIFSLASFKSLFTFGNKWLLASLLDTIYKNMYMPFVGKHYSGTETGCFQQSTSLSNLVSCNIAYAIMRSFIPKQVTLHGDLGKQYKLFLRYLSLACFITFPICMFLVVLADPFISVVLTDKWLPAMPFIQILSISFMLYPVLIINRQMLLSQGLSKQNLQAEIIAKAVGFMLFFLFMPYGISWICVSLGCYVWIDILISITFVRKFLPIRWSDELKIILPILGLALLSGFVAWCAVHSLSTNDFWKLAVGGISGVSAYLIGSYFLGFEEVKFILEHFQKCRK